ncbi:transglycosylase family protein [Streptomyces sp. M19]
MTSAGIALPPRRRGRARRRRLHLGPGGRVRSGGVWSANSGNGFYGGLQLTLDMWKKNGGELRPAPRPRQPLPADRRGRDAARRRGPRRLAELRAHRRARRRRGVPGGGPGQHGVTRAERHRRPSGEDDSSDKGDSSGEDDSTADDSSGKADSDSGKATDPADPSDAPTSGTDASEGSGDDKGTGEGSDKDSADGKGSGAARRTSRTPARTPAPAPPTPAPAPASTAARPTGRGRLGRRRRHALRRRRRPYGRPARLAW